jgi:nicotinamide riboside transporter PnuC
MLEGQRWITMAITAVCLAGTVLNVRKSVLCFYLWMVGNVAWLLVDLSAEAYSRAVLDAVQFGFAAWGAIAWSRKATSGEAKKQDA